MSESDQDAWRWTGIGSLPFDDPDEAVTHVRAAYPRLPFVPQIGARGEPNMLRDVLPPLATAPHPGYGVKLERIGAEDAVLAAFEDEDPTAVPALVELDRFLAHAETFAPDAVFKFQLAGPITLLHGIRDGGSIPLWAYPDLHEPVAAWVRAVACEAAKRLLEHRDPVTVWLDEPVAGLDGIDADDPDTLALLRIPLEALADLDVDAGLHCCSAPPVALLAEPSLTWFSFDAVRHAQALTTHADRFAGFVHRGGHVVLGVAQPFSPDEDRHPRDLIRAWLAASTAPVSADEARTRVVLSPSCGTRIAPPERERTIATLLAAWARDLARDFADDSPSGEVRG